MDLGASNPWPFVVLVFVGGVLTGVLLMIVGRWIVEWVRSGRQRREARRRRQYLLKGPARPLLSLYQPPTLLRGQAASGTRRIPGQGGIGDFMDPGKRARPFGPEGPRDW